MSLRGILNVEGAIALAWVVALWFRSKGELLPSTLDDRRWRWLLLLTPLPFLPFLSFPFLADDYVHILYARALDSAHVKALFTIPGADRFFRPAGYLAYGLDAKWAGLSPTLWRLSSLALHIINVLLVFLLCRTLRFQAAPAVMGALLFGLHGSRPEAVTWVAARFDLLAVMFGLLCLLLMMRGLSGWAALALFAAVLSKESAFAVPLLAALLLFHERASWRETIRRTLPLFAVTAVVFVYRWKLIGGIGGYQNAVNGTPQIFNFKLSSSLQALFPRLWGTLLFPLNWTTRPSAVLLTLMALMIVGLVWLATGKHTRRLAGLGILFVYVCALPVHQFLSIGPDLEKARVLYFASIGLAIVFGSLITSRRLLIPAAFVLLFQVAALEHNLHIWKRVGYLAQGACTAEARDLPNVVDGVYFLHTGYPECLEFK